MEVIKKSTNEIANFDKFELKLTEYKKQYEGIIYDLTDAEQCKAAKTDKKAIAKTVKGLDECHRKAKADLLAETRLLDGERKRIKDDLIVLKDAITAQEEEHENIAIKHAAGLHEMVEAITRLSEFDETDIITFDLVKERLALAKSATVDSKFEAREPDGHMAKAKAIELLEGKALVMEKRIKEEKETAERLAKEQTVREEQIRKDVEAEAAQQKEAAALQAKKDAETAKKKAEADKKAAVKAEKDKAEKAAQQKEAAARVEVERLQALADEEAKKVKAKQENQAHRAKVHKEAKESLMGLGKVLDEDTAIIIVKAIASGQIKNVTINY